MLVEEGVDIDLGLSELLGREVGHRSFVEIGVATSIDIGHGHEESVHIGHLNAIATSDFGTIGCFVLADLSLIPLVVYIAPLVVDVANDFALLVV